MEPNKTWQITYPEGMVKYIDFFRDTLFQYEIYDQTIQQYIRKHSLIEVRDICSLGCGTGRHEIELKKMGYNIVGVERNSESVPVIKALFESQNVDCIPVVEANFFDADELKRKFQPGQFDCVLLLFVPLSIEDTVKLAGIFEFFLKPGGLFISNQFLGYEEGFSPNVTLSDNDYAENPFQKHLPYEEREYCIRLNTYKYRDNIIDWTAVYLFQDGSQLKMIRDHDMIDVLLKDSYESRLQSNNRKLELLPLFEVTALRPEANMPKTIDCIVAWRKK